MQFLLDTKVLSNLLQGHPRTTERLLRLPRSQVGLPTPALAEVVYGLSRMARGKRRAGLEARLSSLRGLLRVVPWTEQAAVAFGELKAALERSGRPLEDFDLAIASSALALDAVLLTADDHLRRVPGLKTEDWSQLDSN